MRKFNVGDLAVIREDMSKDQIGEFAFLLGEKVEVVKYLGEGELPDGSFQHAYEIKVLVDGKEYQCVEQALRKPKDDEPEIGDWDHIEIVTGGWNPTRTVEEA